ncbi:MAG: hypothetical protein ACI3Z9_04105 [Candidatus Onthomorpha sp.]
MMKRNVKFLGAILGLGLAFGSANAQEEQSVLKDDAGSFFNGKDVFTIRQGETKKLYRPICVVSEQDAKTKQYVKYADTDQEDVLKIMGADLDLFIKVMETTHGKPQQIITPNDTIFIQADSIRIMNIKSEIVDTPKFVDGVVVKIFKGQFQTSLSRSWSSREREERMTELITEFVDLLGPEINIDINTKESKKRTLSTGLVWGYGYLNYASGNPFTVPASSSRYSLKWSNKWDIMFRFTFCPDNVVSLTSGLGYQSNVFRFDNGISRFPFGSEDVPADRNNAECKLVARYVTVPLILDFRLAKNIKLHIGAIGGLNYRNSHTGFKCSYTKDGITTEQSTGSSFNEFNTFKADAFAGIELSGWTFYVNHSLTNMFSNSYDKDLKPFSFGIMLGL